MAQCVSIAEGNARSAPRTQLFLSAVIRFDRVSAPVRLRDLSSSGARIEGTTLPAIGATASIARGALDARGTIIWRDRKGCGLLFDAPLRLDEWMPPLALREQQVVDDMVEQVRSGITPAPAADRASDKLRNVLPQRLADELAYVIRLLESLGDAISNEPLMVARHGEKLQNLDISGQILGHVAALLVVDRPDQAVAAIGMACLRKRLLRAGL